MSSDLVICIHNFPSARSEGFTGDAPKKGEIYTVTGITRSRRGYFFREIRTFSLYGRPRQIGYKMNRFRPIIDDSKIDIFREIDRDVFDKEKEPENA